MFRGDHLTQISKTLVPGASSTSNIQLLSMERSKHLHNFNLSPKLTWGSQKLLRCMNVDDEDEESTDSDDDNNNHYVNSRRDDVEGFHKFPGERSGDHSHRRLGFKLNSCSPPSRAVRKAVENNTLSNKIAPINTFLRPTGGEKNSPSLNSKSCQKLASKPSSSSPPPPSKICCNEEAVDPRLEKKPTTRPRRNVERKEERPKFSIGLSRKEIEEDFNAMTGKKPPRKPNKHPKSIQMKLDAVFPGSWLSEVHPDRYKVNDNGKI